MVYRVPLQNDPSILNLNAGNYLNNFVPQPTYMPPVTPATLPSTAAVLPTETMAFRAANTPGRPQATMGADALYQSQEPGIVARTPEEIPKSNPYLADLAAQMMATGSSTAPVQSPLEGIARTLTGALGGYFAGQATEAADARQQAVTGRLARTLGLDPAQVAGMSTEEILALGDLQAKGVARGAAADKAAREADKTAFDQERKLRTEFGNISKNFREQRAAYDRIINSVRNPSPAGDIALIFNFMKVLDPTSAVRETEYATAENAGNVPERIRAQYNRLLTQKGRLSDTQRADFLSRAGDLYSGAVEAQRGREDEYRVLSESYGLDPTRTTVDYIKGLEAMSLEDAIGLAKSDPRFEEPEETQAPPEERPEEIIVDGVIHRKNPDGTYSPVS